MITKSSILCWSSLLLFGCNGFIIPQRLQQTIIKPQGAQGAPRLLEFINNNKEDEMDIATLKKEKAEQEESVVKPDVLSEEELNQTLRIVSSEVTLKKFLGQTPAQLPINLIWDRTLDTVEDVTLHLRRLPYKQGWPSQQEHESSDIPTVVVLGSGWAAHAFLKVADTFAMRIIVVSPTNHFLFTPMLASAAVGTVEYRSMTEAVRASNPLIDNYIEGRATSINVKEKKLTIELENLMADIYEGKPDPIQLSYDYLVCAVGCKVRSSMVPGADKHCYFLKTCDDARRLRTSVGEAMEYASRPDVFSKESPSAIQERKRRVTFAIVGGGPTGVELAGELSDFLRDICRQRVGAFAKLADDYQVLLIHGGPDLVPQFDESLRRHAKQSLEKRGVKLLLNTKTTQVEEGYITISTKGSDEEPFKRLAVGLTVWCAGTEPVPFINELLDQLPLEARGPDGRINVDPWMRCPTPITKDFGSILVLGDAARFQENYNDTSSDASSSRNADLLPQTAQVAGQQGAFAARLLSRGYNLTSTPPRLLGNSISSNKNNPALQFALQLRGLEEAAPFHFLNLGLLAYVGGGEALSQVQLGDVPVFSYAGSIAFVLWRSVYLVKQVATRNRVLVTFDWLKSAIFGRDITRL